jgi:hypothetical protein
MDFNGLVKLNRELVAEVKGVASLDRVMLDMESSESPVYREHVRDRLSTNTSSWSAIIPRLRDEEHQRQEWDAQHDTSRSTMRDKRNVS